MPATSLAATTPARLRNVRGPEQAHQKLHSQWALSFLRKARQQLCELVGQDVLSAFALNAFHQVILGSDSPVTA
jgi:hypothetical protein